MSISGLRFGYVAFKVSNVEQSLRWYADGTGSAGSLAATQNHLSDMKRLSWELLELVKKH